MKRHILYLTLMLTLLLSSCAHKGEEGDTHDHETAEKHGHDHDGDEEESDEIELTQLQMETVGIELGVIERKRISEVIHANGQLAVGSQSEGMITPLLNGVITKIMIKEGDYVGEGQIVAYVESTELAPLRQEYLVAVSEEKMARQEYERQKALAAQGAGVRKNLEIAEAALKVAEAKTEGIIKRLEPYGVNPKTGGEFTISMPVKSEVAGTVSKVNGRAGGYADMQTPIATVTNYSEIYGVLQVFEKDLSQIYIGQYADLKLTNNPGNTFYGKVTEIYKTIDPATKTIPVRVELSGARGTLIPGMALTGAFDTNSTSSETLPEEAVVSSGGRNYIFMLSEVHEENGGKNYVFVKKEVNVGAREMGRVEIMPLDHIPEDAKIVVANAFYLNSMAADHGEHSH